MKKVKGYLALLLPLLLGCMWLTSCDEDWWEDKSLYELAGEWRIVESSNEQVCQPYDRWSFNADWTFEMYNNDGSYYMGDWDVNGRTLYVRLTSSNPEIVAYVREYTVDYLVLDVDDYAAGTSYTLRLVRQTYYSQAKQGSSQNND